MNLDEYVRFVEPSFDSAIIGVSHDYRLIYSYNRMVEEYMDQHQCSADEAMEWIEVNTIPSLPYYENSPIILMEYLMQ
jgi:hypothetical protein